MGLLDFLFGSDDRCTSCSGSGYVDKGIQRVPCPYCSGSGKESDVYSNQKDHEGNSRTWKDIEDEYRDKAKYF